MSGKSSGALGTLLRNELRMLLRDRRTIVISVLVPLAIWPAMILLMSWTESREQEQIESSTLVWTATGERAEFAREHVLEAIAARAAQDESGNGQRAQFEERTDVEDPAAALSAGELDLVVEGLSPAEWERVRDDSEEPAGDLPVIRLLYRDNSDLSSTAMGRVRSGLQELRAERRVLLLLERGFPVEPDAVASVELANVASAQEEAGAALGIALTPLIVLLMLSGGSIVAVDAIAGEKERGTLETLLTSAASRSEIVLAKQLAIVLVGLAIAVINVANLVAYVVLGVFDLPETFAQLSVTPLSAVVLLVLFVPLAVLIASILLLVSGYAKSYKEYQIYFFPIFLLLMMPALASVLPGLSLRSVVSLVPIAGVSVAAREVMSGELDWLGLAVCFLSTAAVAAWLARRTMDTLSTEKLITASELDRADLEGGPSLFPRHVLQWFAVMWVVLLMVSSWFGTQLGIFGQVAVNLVGIFLGGSLLMIWRYRLDVRTALALRPVRPMVWLAVLIGAPAGFLTGQAVFQLANLVFPVPTEVLEAFGQFLVPEDLSPVRVFLMLCLLPGIVEEIAFRGVLLHGLRRRFGPVALCLVTAAIFGLFHVSLFRLIPTAYIGLLLAAVVLLTGSIFPAMAWHTLNNATALVPSVLGWYPEDTVLPWWWSLVGVAGLAVAFGLLWMNRRPYPGLRGSAPDSAGRATTR